MAGKMDAIVDRLLRSEEPSVRYKVRVHVLREHEDSSSIRALRVQIRHSPRVKGLLSHRRPDGRIEPVGQVYKKWVGAHWILASLADIGYPPGDASLRPAMQQVFDCWLSPEALAERVCRQAPAPHRDRGVPVVNGRARRCASQQGNALFAALALGFVDEHVHALAEGLLRWQWPDGGWNCDRKPEARNSSFFETLIPLRALSLYARVTGNQDAAAAADRAADVFLKRRLFRRISDGQVMDLRFLMLHYPCYWHYDILFALKVMTEAGFIWDMRCVEALDILESKRLSDGGWPAEERFYKTSTKVASARDLVSWGGVNKRHMNEWVTADALCVLHAAGRL